VHDPRGTFRLARLGPGAYTLEAVTASGQRAESELSIAEGELRQNLRLTVAESTTLAGQVLDFETAAPVAGAETRASLPMGTDVTRTDREGRFSFANVPRGAAAGLLFSAQGYAETSLRVHLPRAESPPEPVIARLRRRQD
jgi:hypothetical protein